MARSSIMGRSVTGKGTSLSEKPAKGHQKDDVFIHAPSKTKCQKSPIGMAKSRLRSLRFPMVQTINVIITTMGAASVCRTGT
tara:strand:- start:3905 stop:4150 length:246 start_codon:yes stop_codon:yes gene_type:complete